MLGSAATAWLWSLQFALLNPVLAVLLTTVFGASGSQAGLVLAIFNAAGFVASVVIPAVADRRGDYAAGMLFSACCGVAFVGVLLATDSIIVAAVGLVLLGAPTGVGATLLFAQLQHAGSTPETVIRTRAVVSSAWVLGPPLSTLITSLAPGKAVLLVVGGVGLVNLVTSLRLLRSARAVVSPRPVRHSPVMLRDALRRPRVWGALTVFVVLQALNAAAVTTTGLFVTTDLHAPLVWAGAALGLSAFAEVPALLVLGRLLRRLSARQLLVVGSVVGAVYYLTVVLVHRPLALVLLQPLNAWFFATVAGVGLTAFQGMIPSPGLAAGIFANTRQVAAILSGGLIALVAQRVDGYGSLYWVCAVGAAAVGGALVVSARRPHSGALVVSVPRPHEGR